VTPPAPALIDAPDLAALAGIARRVAGLNLPPAKYPMMRARLRKRMVLLGFSEIGQYRAFLDRREGRDECAHMAVALTTHVSQFFREPHHFDLLRTKVLPDLLSHARGGGRVRLWSAGCANGQEAYSIALTILEMMPDATRYDLRILATDLAASVIDRARQGRFALETLAHVPPRLRHQFRTDGKEMVELAHDPRDLIRFEVQNLHQPWPMQGQFDVIFCRNVLIYFEHSACERLLSRFAAALTPDGWLFLGHAERLSGPATAQMRHAGQTCYRRLAPSDVRKAGGHRT